MAPRSKGRQAVYLVVPPPDWKPQRLWDFPPSFSDGEIVARNLTPQTAAGYARTHNKAALERQQRQKLPIDKWAIVGRHLKANWHGSRQPEKGGSA
ncbi:MAG: hypothetical protein ACOX1P_16530 [Thermoguttaceae bacterium]